MAKYGAVLTYPDGKPFYIDGTRPLALLRKQSFNLKVNDSNNAVLSLDSANTGNLFMYFVFFNSTSCSGRQGVFDGNNCIFAYNYNGGYVSGDVYVFSIFNQPTPKYGIAVWDSSGNSILTNETKVLKGMERCPPVVVSGARYLNYDTGIVKAASTLSTTGLVTYRLGGGGGVTPIAQEEYYSGCARNGATTLLYSVPGVVAGSGGSVVSSAGYGFFPYFIDASMYD